MSVTPDHFENHDWRQVLKESERPLRSDYHLLFAKRAEEARENENVEGEELFSLLQKITFPHFDLESEGPPFPTLEKIEEDSLNALSLVFEEIGDPEFRARVGDVLWLNRDRVEEAYKFALEAIDAYLEAGARLHGVLSNQETVDRLARAASLASRLNQEEKQAAVRAALEERIQNHALNEESLLVRQYSELLYENGLGNPKEQAEIMEREARFTESAEEEEEVPDYYTSRNCWDLAARWHFRAGNTDEAHDARRRKAEAFVQLAEMHRPQLSAADFYAEALKVLQGVPGSEERYEKVRRAMVEAREEADPGGLVQINPDITDEEVQENSVELVEGLSLEKALTRFADIASISGPEALREETIERNRQRPLEAMLATTKHGSRRRKIAEKESGMDDPEDSLDYQTHQTARRNWKKDVVNRIDPSRQVISDEHNVGIEKLEPFVEGNPIIPPGRELSFAKGLAAGFNGDYLISIHLLTLQIEESIRHLLRKSGVITTALKGNFEEEHNLNNFLKSEDYQSNVAEIFGGEIAWQLRSLLVDARGANLRNKVAHSLRSDGEYLYRASSRYYWWLVWHLLVSPPPDI